jgi:hypothetical protein
VDETFGRGIMPLTFEALKGQRYRWCFGGIQILRMHWRSMMPGRSNGRFPLPVRCRCAIGRALTRPMCHRLLMNDARRLMGGGWLLGSGGKRQEAAANCQG